MKCIVFLGFLALTSAFPGGNVQVRLAFQNPAGITLTGAGFAPTYQVQQLQQFAAGIAQPQPEQQEQEQQVQQQVQAEEAQPQPLIAEEPQPAQQQEVIQEQPQQQEPVAHAPLPYAPPPVIPYAQPQQYHRQVVAPAVPVAPVAAYGHYHQQVAPVQYAAAPVAAYGHYGQYQQVAAPAHVQYAAPVAAAYGQYGHYQQVAAPAHVHYAHHAPALAVHQKVGYAATPFLTKVAGVADVPVTKLAYTHGVTQKLVDVAHPAVTTRKVKVRRPALRKEFYDIEHRVIVRPAGSATLELSQPISKVQKGPTVLTPTKFQHLAPVIRYGASRQILDGQGGPVPELRSAAPQPQAPVQLQRSAAPESLGPAPRAGPAPSAPQPRGQFRGDADSEVIESADQPAQPQQQEQQQQEQAPQQQDQPQQQVPQQEQQQQPEQPAAPAPAPEQGRALTITPNMPAELQARLLELLSARGGTVTEILNEDGKPADSASVLQVADALGDPSLQGGERITTRRIVVTRPVETVQEIEVQEPATKVFQHVVNQPTLFKTAIPAVARVPVALPAVKHLATPVVKTSYLQPTYAQPAYDQPAFAQPAYAQPAFAAYAKPAFQHQIHY